MRPDQKQRLREGLGDELYFTLVPMTPELHKELRDRILDLRALCEKLMEIYRTAEIRR